MSNSYNIYNFIVVYIVMISEDIIGGLLQPFGITLSQPQIGSLIVYLNLLLRWNEKINLTAIRTPQECVTRHFGESLLLACHEQLTGSLLDIGSGAGFPALALKLVFPELNVTLLEPVAKKRAFLKEVVRVCAFSGVEVRGERLQDLKKENLYDTITMRAVGSGLVKEAVPYLKPLGKVYLWLSKAQAKELVEMGSGLEWDSAIEIPESRERIILPGSLKV
ncbi:MAG TPA: 16S rRNA (guanine(527)-N(7))-methyltransferase RsmG [Terriglobia bacterium]|nr:16S rRNA (guanine(527)-N(7))-methyltransferase RsmG [Terriglobia bacterium]